MRFGRKRVFVPMSKNLLLRQLKGLSCIREGLALSRPSYVAATERGPPNESTPFVAVSIKMPLRPQKIGRICVIHRLAF